MLSTYTHNIGQNHSFPQIQFSCINLSSLSITIINQLPTKFIFISELNLDNNLLGSLSGIEQFMNLQILSVNFNFISEKEEVLKIRNKFMMRELSFVGNEIQNMVGEKWLRQQGFSGLIRLNQIKRIGHVAPSNNSFNQNDVNNFNQHSFSKQYNRNIKPYPKTQRQMHNQVEINPETKRLHNDSAQNSQFMYITNRDNTSRLTKNKSRYESTGDTRRQKLLSQQLHQTSRYGNSFESSPNFNQFRENSFQNQRNEYLSSTRKHNISEFRLYPVDEEMNRSRVIENQHIEPSISYHNFTNNYNHRSIPSSNKPQRFINTNQLKVRAFQYIDEGQHMMEHDDGWNHYRSDRYQIEPRQNRQTRTNVKSQQSDNNVIEKQIPVYKQAIAIAFYYRNLLEKVFRGFTSVLRKNKEEQSQQLEES